MPAVISPNRILPSAHWKARPKSETSDFGWQRYHSGRSERDLVVHVATLAAAGADGGRLARRARRADIAARARIVGTEMAATAGPVAVAQRGIEILQPHFGGVSVLAGLVLPLACLQRAFEIDLRALLQILLASPAETLAEDHDAVPFGLFPPFPGCLVAPRIAGGDPQIGNRPAVLGPATSRVPPGVADREPLVAPPRHDTLSPVEVRATLK